MVAMRSVVGWSHGPGSPRMDPPPWLLGSQGATEAHGIEAEIMETVAGIQRTARGPGRWRKRQQ